MNDNDKSSRRAARKRWQLMLAQKRLACLMTVGAEYVEAVCNYLYLLRLSSGPARWYRCWSRPRRMLIGRCSGPIGQTATILGRLKTNCSIQLRNAAAAASMVPYYSDEQRTFFESLPEVVTIYRR